MTTQLLVASKSRRTSALLAAAMLLGSAAVVGAQNITTLAGRGIGDGRPGPAASLDTPVGVEVAADGAILIADSQQEGGQPAE